MGDIQERIAKLDVLKYREKIGFELAQEIHDIYMSLEVPGQVVDAVCLKCQGEGSAWKRMPVWGESLMDCDNCNGTGKTSRPATIKDLIEGE